MDWVTNGLKLLGLAVLALWEYILFRQRYRTKSDKLKAKQVEGAVAILGVLNSFLTTLNADRVAPHGASADLAGQEIVALHSQAIALHRKWIAVLPNEVNERILRCLTLAQKVTSSPRAPNEETRQQMHRAYLDVVASVRQTLNIAPLGRELEEKLANVT